MLGLLSSITACGFQDEPPDGKQRCAVGVAPSLACPSGYHCEIGETENTCWRNGHKPDGSIDAGDAGDARGTAGASGTSGALGGAGGRGPDAGAGGSGGVGATGGSGGMPIILTPAVLTLDPLSKDLGVIVIGHFAEATFQVSNTGETATTLPSVTLDGADAAQYSMPSNTCNAVIPGGKSCLVTVRFTPTTAGLKAARLNVSATMGGALAATLQGTGVIQGALTIDPPNLSLGSVLKGQTSAASTLTVTNTGGAPTGALATTISDSTEIAIATDGCKGMILAGNAKCTITITLTGTTAGPKSATLSVTGTPGGTGSAGLTGTVLAPALLVVTPATAAFGDTVVGTTSAAQTFTVTNSGGVAAGSTTALASVLSLSSGTNAAEFAIASTTCVTTLAAGAACAVGVIFKPTSAATNKGATLTVSAAPGGMGSASMTGNGLSAAVLTLSPAAGASPDFATVVTNTSATQTFVVSNGGQQATSALAVSTTGTDFIILPAGAGDCTGTSPLAAGASCTVQVKFAPTTTGAKTSTLSASATTGGGKSLPLTGMAVAPGSLTIAPLSQNFGSLLQNTASAPSMFTVTNMGGAATTALSTAISGSSDYAITTDGCTTKTLLAAGTCVITVTFTPTSGGQKSGTLTVSAVTGGTTASNLTGIGLTSAVLTVSPAIFTFPAGTVSGTMSAAQTFTVTNTGGVVSGAVASVIGGTDATQFGVASSTCTTVAPGGSCTIGVVFKPTAAGGKAGTLTLTASPGGSAAATLGGTALAPAKLTIAPASGASNDFGSILVGNTMLQTFVVANSGQVATSTPLTITVTGTDFALATPPATGDCAGTTSLAPSASCVVRVQFKPTAAVVRTGAVSVSAATGGTATLAPAPTGTGVAPSSVSMTPLTQTFGSVLQGMPSVTHTFTVTNTGGVATAALATSITPATDFTFTPDGCKGKILVPLTGTCTMTVVMTPQGLGSRSATLTVTDSASGSSSSAALSGAGLSNAVLAVSPTTFTFPAGTASGSTSLTTATFTVSNTGGVASGTITAAIGGTDASQFGIASSNCTTLAATTTTCAVGVVFHPTTTGIKAGTLTLTANPGGTASATLSGTAVSPAVLTITPPAPVFGPVAQGSSTALAFTVTNTGGAVSGALSTAISGATDFAITAATDTCKGKTLAAGATCTLTVVMTPIAPPGSKTATLTVSASPGSSATSMLSGSSFTAASLTLVPSAPPLGNVALGSTKDVLVVLANSGTQSATITKTIAGAGFSLPAPAGTECVTTAAGSMSCSIRVRFTPPGLVGNVTGTLTVTPSTGGALQVSLPANAYGIIAVPFPTNLRIAHLGGMDGSGTAVVGLMQTTDAFGYYWKVGTPVAIAIPPITPSDGSSADARAISGNGLVVTGVAFGRPWTWTPGAAAATSLGFEFARPGESAFPLGTNQTGSVIVGTTGAQSFAYRTALSGFEFLGNGDPIISANCVSDNGRIAATQFGLDGSQSGITWATVGNAVQQPGTILPGGAANVNAISGDGTVIIGSSSTSATVKFTGAPSFATQTPLATPPNAIGQSFVLGINQNGTVIVGGTDAGAGTSRAIVWTPAAVDIAAGLAGAPNIGSFSLQSARSVSTDGKIFAGEGTFTVGTVTTTRPWIARLP